MGGAPPLPHDFAPQGAKNRTFFAIFGPRRPGGPLASEGRRTWVREAREARLGPAGAPAEAWEDPGTPVLRGRSPAENEHHSVADSAPGGEGGDLAEPARGSAYGPLDDGKERVPA